MEAWPAMTLHKRVDNIRDNASAVDSTAADVMYMQPIWNECNFLKYLICIGYVDEGICWRCVQARWLSLCYMYF